MLQGVFGLYLCHVINQNQKQLFQSRKLIVMKNLLLIPFLVLVLTSVKAADFPTLTIAEDKAFVLNINDWNHNELNISFLTPEGIEIYSERIQPTGDSQKKYNLQILKKGTYQVIVSSGTRNITYDIEITENSITKISKGRASQNSQELTKDIRSKIKFINN